MGRYLSPQSNPHPPPPPYPSTLSHDDDDMSDIDKTEYAIDSKTPGAVEITPAFESREPESLRGLSEAELKIMERKLVRKIDLIIFVSLARSWLRARCAPSRD